MSLKVDKFTDRLIQSLGDQVDEAILKRLRRMKVSLDALNKEFFKELDRLIVGATEAPALPGTGLGGLNWKALKDPGEYVSRRKRKHKIGPGVFFKSGRKKSISNFFKRANLYNIFGTPTLTYKLGSVAEGDKFEVRHIQRGKGFQQQFFGKKGTLLPGGGRKIPSSLTARIELDPYPSVGGGLMKNNNVEGFFPESGIGGNVAAKLSNPGPGRGHAGQPSGRKRLVMRHYMVWWMKVKMKRVMREAV